jgi:hypothetical protein
MVNARQGPNNNRKQHGQPIPPPPPNPNMEQFIAAQMQFLQGLTAIVQQIQQNQLNQQHQQQQQNAPPTRDKHRDFMSHHPPKFSHAVDPLDADEWLKIIGKKLDITQCNDREKVLYASGRLEGATSDWWDDFTATHPNADTITWQEFQANFHAHHIPSGIMKLKKKEFLSLTQRNMTVSEYRDCFNQLSRYTPKEVDTDDKCQERFLEGLIGPLNYQLQSHTFPNFQTLLNKTIGLESKRRELSDHKRKFQCQSSRNTRPNNAQGSQFRFGNQGGNNYQAQRSGQQGQRSNQSQNQQRNNSQTNQRSGGSSQNRQGGAMNTQARSNNAPVQPNGCFKCGELGHYANNCPRRNQRTPQKSNTQRNDQNTPTRGSAQNKTPQNQGRGRVNHVTTESVPEDADVVYGMFLVNSIPASILFDSGASHSFITESFVEKHNLPKYPLKKMLHISSPRGDMKATHSCLHVNLKIQGIDFSVNLVVLGSNGIDVILGCNWLKSCDGVIPCANGTITLTSSQGKRVQVSTDMSTNAKGKTVINHLEEKPLESIKVVCEYPDVFPAELPGMPPGCDIEFFIELLPRTAPISKRPYRMDVKDLVELKKQIEELL